MIWKLILSALVQALGISADCTCVNPLVGHTQEYYGVPDFACGNNDWCFVRCDSACSDKTPRSGIFSGKCSSALACQAREPSAGSGSAAFDCKCGLTLSGSKLQWIVGGTETEKNEYPWQVGFVRKDTADQIWCGGSLVSDRWVLTAAHCTCCAEGQKAENLQVLLGEHNQAIGDNRTIRSDIEKIVNHPKYNKATHNDYDISLVKLVTIIDFTKVPNVRPICLPVDDGNDYKGYLATVSGWGKTGVEEGLSSVLQEVDVKVIGDESCRNDFKYTAEEITDQMMCAHVAEGGMDSCQGDSGGPLMSYGSGDGFTPGQNFELLGVVSWGVGCADPDYPGVYTRVSRQLGWIAETTADEWSTCPRV